MTGPILLWIAACALVALGATFAASRVRRALSSRVEQEQRRAERTAELQLATLEALALAVDAREHPPRNGKRVQYFAAELATALGIGGDELDAIRTAALLRDVGKLAVPEHILARPGPLTPEEREKVKCHPRAGADIIGVVPFPFPVAPLILSHHERWDGSGYPDGLRGTEIPRGARILAVADRFDALVSARPYHSPAAPEAAAIVLRQEAGLGLDPVAVNTFLSILPTLFEPAGVPNQTPSTASSDDGPPRDRRAADARLSVLDEISVAHHELDALYEISRSMGTTLGVAETMALISSKLTDLVPFSTCALFLMNEANDRLRCWFATGVESEMLLRLSFAVGQGHIGWVARHRAPLTDVPPTSDFASAGWTDGTGLQSGLISPLVTGEQLVGVLCLYQTVRGAYTRDHRRIMQRVCDQAAAVIHNSLVFDRTKAASLSDPLTGLPNRRVVQSHMAAELARAERSGTELALIMLDVDDFKAINDTHGHHAGDHALKHVASALSGVLRPYDVCARFAGDEFVVVLAECGPKEAESKRRDLQEAVDRLELKPIGADKPLSVSAGVACYPRDGADYETLLAVADRRMYENKAHGKSALGAHSMVHLVSESRESEARTHSATSPWRGSPHPRTAPRQ